MSFGEVAGHARPIRVLRRALSTGRVPHAYLFWGPNGVGKERVARETAKVLFCHDAETSGRADACGVCASCRKIEAGAHPDLQLLVAGGASIRVADVRSLQETLSYQAFERGRKIAIIRDAFRMTGEAANALLKTLEEPSVGTHIFLLTEHRNQILPTVVSRCQLLRFDPIPVGEVGRLLEAGGMGPAMAQALAQISGGCPGTVASEDPEAVIALEREVAGTWCQWEQLGVAERFAISSRWVSEKDRLEFRLDSLERCLQRSARETALAGAVDSLAAAVLGGIFRVRSLMQRNVNTQLAVDTLFLGVGSRDWEDSF